ncbi:uncharacterized protein TRIVIDRAFT_51866 [Trichoderma virens Gv29-8]|uniref:Aspartate racemase n=1 Tax=Hypocrea virens (strain Gv29-8 / FGSC 10586) TaxID=413071 RepID=G9MWH0_HYPVG|nr:uncharacterized protein TRIVIDRAFT_51866 [Trichoderma virens Gv29-8]EHK21139.1 hypothetical protein TRIVIDRAFT_51866 [Trichoderma virens Gv29-8]
MKTIGIIGGCTDLATVEYYKLINMHIRAKLGGLNTGEIIINSMNFERSAHYVRNGLWDEGAEYLHQKALSLERAGADFIICVANTWHRVSEVFMKGVKIPLYHIVDPTAQAILNIKLHTVALLGTKATMSSDYLPNEFTSRFGINIIIPVNEEQTYIDDVIFNELAKSQFTEKSRQGFLSIVDKLVARGAQGVILGCTEIPLLIEQKDRPDIPLFNTLELHARATAEKALSD